MSDTEKRFVTYLKSDLPKLVISGPVSSETTFALHMTGPITSREIANVITILEVHRGWLEDDETSQDQRPSP